MTGRLIGNIYRPSGNFMGDGHYIGNTYVRGIMQGAVRQGLRPKTILKKAGISPEAYDDPKAKLTGVEGQRLIFTLQGILNDVLLGFMEQPCTLAFEQEQLRARHRGITLGDTLVMSTQFRQAVRHDMEYDYITDDKANEFTVISRYKTVEGMNGHFLYWVRLLSFRQYYSWLVGKYLPLNYLCFTHSPPDPEHMDNYFGFFNCEVRFNQPDNSYTFSKNYLKYPIMRSVVENQDFFALCPDCFVAPTYETSWSRRTEHALLRLQHDGIWVPSIATVAGMMSLTARTLRRYLAQENESFRRIKTKLRRDEAIRLLTTTQMPIAAISTNIGFGEPGEFTRAFVEWTGHTPSQYRSLHREGIL